MTGYFIKLWFSLLLASDLLFFIVYKLSLVIWPNPDEPTATLAMIMLLGGIHQFCFVALTMFLVTSYRNHRSVV